MKKAFIKEASSAALPSREGISLMNCRRLFDVSPSGIVVYETNDGDDFLIIDINKAAEKIDGVRKKDVIGRNVVDIFPSVDDIGLLDVFRRVWKTGKEEHHPTVFYKDNNISGWRENFVYKLDDSRIVALYQDRTSDKKKEDEAIRLKDEYVLIMDSLTDPVMTIGLDFKIKTANAVSKILLKRGNIDIKDYIGKSVLDLPIFNNKEVKRDYLEIIKTGKMIEREVIYASGGEILYSKTKRIPIISAGKVSGILIVVHDITREKAVELELRKTLNRFELISKLAGEWIWSVDSKGVFTYSSSASLSILGISPDKMVGKSGFELMDPLMEPKFRKVWASLLKDKEEFRKMIVVMITSKGEKVFLEVNGIPVFDDEGVFSGYSGVSSDVTDRQHYEENLQKFKLAVENASDHIIITDPDGTILFANSAASKITGYEIKEIMGNKPSLWGKQMPSDFYKNMWHEIKDLKRDFTGELTNKRKNGEIYIAEVKVSPILDSEDNIKFFVGIEHDITRMKEVDRAKTEFVSLASHQLRTPLSIVNWYSEILLSGDKGALTVDQREYILEVNRSNHRMIELVNALLNTSRIDMGTFMVSPKMIDFREIADVSIAELFPQIEKKKIKMVKDYGDIPNIDADPSLIRIIFQNIIGNAVKYTPSEGRVSVGISRDGNNVLISVSDTGCGIPERQKSKIFSKLFRADNAREIDQDGTGLGLYIAKAIVDMAKGDIWFESKEGKGTTFFVRLPLSGMKEKEGVKGLS
ncbi:MAG: PAS domain S-box protein [Candidatus Colwellbacteria bacterium]|nr:PAS domain S-box protein [Candidatus Colwellbacteria bacterium]